MLALAMLALAMLEPKMAGPAAPTPQTEARTESCSTYPRRRPLPPAPLMLHQLILDDP